MPYTFDLASGKRIARSVRKTEADNLELVGRRRQPGQILSVGVRAHWGKLDAQLDASTTTGVACSIWAMSGSNAWADTTDNIDVVWPPPTMMAGTHIDSGSFVKIELIDGDWFVTLAPC